MWFSLSLILVAASLRAAVPTPMGTLRCDGMVHLDQSLVPGETTVYNGDRIVTDEGRATVSFPHGDLLVLDRESRAALGSSPEGFLVGLERGQLSVAISAPQPIRVETEGLTISRIGSFPSLAEVALHADGSVLVAVHRGSVAVSGLRREPVVVQAGHILRVSRRLAQSQGQSQGQTQPIGTAAHGKLSLGDRLRTFQLGRLNHAASATLLFVGLAALGTAAVVIPLSIKETPVSPWAP
jgi:ferric-dicitrate binding protein FerR (iron transport regulator)